MKTLEREISLIEGSIAQEDEAKARVARTLVSIMSDEDLVSALESDGWNLISGEKE